MKTPVGTEVDIGAGHIILDGFPALRERGTAPPPSFRPMSIVAMHGRPSQLLLSSCTNGRPKTITGNWIQIQQVGYDVVLKATEPSLGKNV